MSFIGTADGSIGGVKKAPIPKICQTYPTNMKLDPVMPYPKKIKKNINHLTYPLTSADIIVFNRKSATFVRSRNEGIDCILIHNFQFFKKF